MCVLVIMNGRDRLWVEPNGPRLVIVSKCGKGACGFLVGHAHLQA
uniref:Uncharacterized protein n=1 Tax=Anguilla anguilla TaxID=7936 RepID=A0A0E9XAJ2_ANGAN